MIIETPEYSLVLCNAGRCQVNQVRLIRGVDCISIEIARIPETIEMLKSEEGNEWGIEITKREEDFVIKNNHGSAFNFKDINKLIELLEECHDNAVVRNYGAN